jgi:nucleoside-diphosphate-sugar epimerase
MFYDVERKSILVTGGTGFIGYYLVQKLSEAGNIVKVLAREHSDVTHLKDLNNVSIVKGDICDISTLHAAVDSVDIVYHLAAILHVPHNVRSYKITEVNVKGTRNLLEACREKNVGKFIFFSTAGVSLVESSLNKNIDPVFDEPLSYVMSKFLGEILVYNYYKEFDLNTTIIRPAVVYGFGERGNVKKLIDAVQKRCFILIGDGTNRRSLTYVQNAVNAALCVAVNPKTNGKVYIVTDGEPLSIKEIAEVIAEKCNVSLIPVRIPLWVAHPAALLCDLLQRALKLKLPFNMDILRRVTYNQVCSSHLIIEELGFTPIGFREGISETILKMSCN